MQVTRFHIDDYIDAGEAFHFARKQLERRFPDRAHDHDYFEVFLIEKGKTLHWVNGRTERLTPGHLAFVRPQDAHAFSANRQTGCQIINVMFRVDTAAHLVVRYPDEFSGRFFDWDGPQPEAYVLQGPRFERAVNVAQELRSSIRSLARIEEFLLTLINRVVERKSHPNSTAPHWFTAACQAVRDPEVFRRGSAGFVDAAGRSHEHVCRVTRTELGQTPSAFVNRVRIEHAAMLLGHGRDAIPEVARTCGFENLSHFYRLFRAQYGVTPRQYRLRHQQAPF
ncbi:MAG: AraC family transcriptional regulator [Rhodobacter sp.]|nr:AraC family transcriptional regulator [Rhodobacter sp.]